MKINVVIDARQANTHRLKISIKADKFPNKFQFPVWTPGSYLVREYSKHITKFSGGTKINKNSWKLNPKIKEVSYEVACFEKTVRTSYVDQNYAMLIGSTILPLLNGAFSVTLLCPKKWHFVASSLNFKKVQAGKWQAKVKDDDEWIDSPIIAASPCFGETMSYRSQNITHRFAWVGVQPDVDFKNLMKDFKAITDTTIKMFGGAPFKKHYDILFHFHPKLYGGLEHRKGQLSQFDGSELSKKDRYQKLLTLFAHEYFHAWNVKSIRPEELGPFNYLEENYTEELWMGEGMTTYFEDYLVHKAGLINKKLYEQERLNDLRGAQDGFPGHSRRSLKEASFDAWIRLYRPDEDGLNTNVSYYPKGALLCWYWDMTLQKKSKGKWNLQKLAKKIWQEFGVDADIDLRSAKAGYTRAELIDFCQQTTKISHDFIEKFVSQRKQIPWQEAAKFFQLNYQENVTNYPLHHFGLNLSFSAHYVKINNIAADSTAEAAGLVVGDEIIAIDGLRVESEDHFQILTRKAKKKPYELLIARGSQILRHSVQKKAHKAIGVEYKLSS